MIENKVKLVVWDLDDTFWQGTLTEGGITHVDRNIEIVKELARRGIISSICSKNDFELAKAELLKRDIWDYFVFPVISFNPKGKAIAEMIEGAALRAENVLFVDDNPSNLEEVKFFNPGIMAAHPMEVLDLLLDHPNLEGKPDLELTRLKQYQFLQRKVEERSTSSLSNEEFLRQSNIRVTIDHDIEGNFGRIIELINRTNQLNYTKKRLNTPDEMDEFKNLLDHSFAYYAGCVHAVDNYGDYGMVGFFLVRRRAVEHELVHFVFSCRTMNMGIEQYVYDLLGRPDIEIVGGVSYGVRSHEDVDWINRDDHAAGGSLSTKTDKLLLLGGCDLLQLASYCSTNRVEFVNTVRRGVRIRYDDPGFVLNDRKAVRDCVMINRFPSWSYEDAMEFDEAVATSNMILLSLWPGMNCPYYEIDNGVRVRMADSVTAFLQKEKSPIWFAKKFKFLKLDDDERLKLISAAFDSIAVKSKPGCRIFSLGCYTRGVSSEKHSEKRADRRAHYNRACREYCEQSADLFTYVDLDAIVPPETLVDGIHFSRRGYFELARYILSAMEGEPEKRMETGPRAAAE